MLRSGTRPARSGVASRLASRGILEWRIVCDQLRRWWRSALRVVMGKDKLRPDEEFAANRLQEMLTEIGVASTWKPGDDPPDIVFEVEGLGRWAIEVTSLYQYITKDGKEESEAAVTEPLIKMSERAQAQVTDLSNSDYLIMGFGPILSPSLRELEKRAIAYIRSGGSDEEALDDDKRIRISRQKRPVQVGWAIGLDGRTPGAGGTMSADIEGAVTYALDRILGEKLPSLAALAGYDRKMLLILKNYFFTEPELVSEILSARSLTREQVDTVLLATESKVHWVADPGEVFVQDRNRTK